MGPPGEGTGFRIDAPSAPYLDVTVTPVSCSGSPAVGFDLGECALRASPPLASPLSAAGAGQSHPEAHHVIDLSVDTSSDRLRRRSEVPVAVNLASIGSRSTRSEEPPQVGLRHGRASAFRRERDARRLKPSPPKPALVHSVVQDDEVELLRFEPCLGVLESGHFLAQIHDDALLLAPAMVDLRDVLSARRNLGRASS